MSGQFLEDQNLYVKMSASVGNYWGGRVTLEYINLKNQSFSAGVYGQWRRAPNLPGDYNPPSSFFKLFRLGYPLEEQNTLYVTTGKILKSNHHTTRFNLAGGIGYSFLSTPIDFIKKTPHISNENYDYHYRKIHAFGLIINPSVDFPVWRYYGFSAGLISIISKDNSSIGIEVSELFGFVRNETNKRKKAKL